MKRFLRKLFKPKPKYEPAGIIHYGQFEVTIGNTTYHAYGQPGNTYNVWAANENDNDILIGTYPKDQAMNAIINHAKDQKRR